MLNSHLGIYYGALEGAQKTEIANLLMISGASLGFLIYTWVLKTNSLVLISLAQALSMIIPGVLIMSYIKITKFELGFRQVALNEIIKLRLKWSTLNFFELLTFALNGFMVLIVLGSTSAAELSLYQKIMIIGSAATSSLGPFYGLFMDSSNQDFKSQIIRRVNIILTICIIFLILLLGSEIFRILGNGEVVMNTEILHLVLANALVGALTASTIQRSNSGHALKVRIVSTGISSLITIVVSALLLPSYGLGVVFAANASASLFVFLALKYYGVRIEN
jgi:O-antigen/teichoic acid export membrane protein